MTNLPAQWVKKIRARTNGRGLDKLSFVDFIHFSQAITFYMPSIQIETQKSPTTWNALYFLQHIFRLNPNWFPPTEYRSFNDLDSSKLLIDLDELAKWLKKPTGPLDMPHLVKWVTIRSDWFYAHEIVKYLRLIRAQNLNTPNNRLVFLRCASALGEAFKYLSPTWLQENNIFPIQIRKNLIKLRDSLAHAGKADFFISIDDFLQQKTGTISSIEANNWLRELHAQENQLNQKIDSIEQEIRSFQAFRAIRAANNDPVPNTVLVPITQPESLSPQENIRKNYAAELNQYMVQINQSSVDRFHLPKTLPKKIATAFLKCVLIELQKQKQKHALRVTQEHKTTLSKRMQLISKNIKTIRKKRKSLLKKMRESEQQLLEDQLKQINTFLTGQQNKNTVRSLRFFVPKVPESMPIGKKIVEELHQSRRDFILTRLLNLLEELEKTPINLREYGPLYRHTGVELCDLLREAKMSLAGAYVTVIPQKDRPEHLNKLSYVRGFLMHTQTLNPKQPYVADWPDVYSNQLIRDCCDEVRDLLNQSLSSQPECHFEK